MVKKRIRKNIDFFCILTYKKPKPLRSDELKKTAKLQMETSLIRSALSFSRVIANAVMAFAALLLLVSCNRTDRHGNDEMRSENVLRYDVNEPLTSFSPADTFCGSGLAFPFLYSYLCIPNPEGQLEPDLAEKWTYDSTTFTWTVTIRKNARFHNGKVVRSDDVAYSINTVLRNWNAVLYASIRQVLPLSDDRIVIVLKKDQPSFLTKIWPMEIIQQPGPNCPNQDFPIGSGPFRYESGKGAEVTLAANEEYYGGRPELNRIVFYYQPCKENTWARLLSGQTDVASEIPPDNYNTIKEKGKAYYFDISYINRCTVLLFNVCDPLFSDLKTRRALACAVDRRRLVGEALSGLGQVPTDIFPEERPDPRKSMALLKEAGWNLSKDGRLRRDGRPFEFTLFVFGEEPCHKKVAAYLQLCFSDLGIRTQIKAVRFESLVARYRDNRDFQAVITEYRLGPSPFCPDANAEETGNIDPDTFRKLACQSGLIKNLKKGKGLSVNPTYDFIISNQPALFLFRKTAIDVVSKRFKLRYPFSLTLEGRSRLKYASVNRSITGKSVP